MRKCVVTETVQNYKCPCCGSPLSFDGKTQNMHCKSCGNNFSAETMQQLEGENKKSHYDWDNYEPRSFSEAEQGGFASYTCPSCGAEITGDDSMSATVCPYCGNSTIVQGKFEGAARPDYIVPFKTDKKSAMEAFENACKKAPFLPNAFKNRKKIEEMSGVYVPFWMFDCDCEADISYNAQQVSHWSDSHYDYTKIDHFRLIRSGSIGFENIPADASKKTDDTYTEAVEPFDCSEAVDFAPGYISGFLAEKYDISAEERKQRANERVKRSTEEMFRSTTGGYSAVETASSYIGFSGGKIRYALLPIWMLNIKYGDKSYRYAINGQTGKVAGDYPVDKRKKRMFFLKTLGIAYAAAAVIVLLLLK